MNVLQENAMTFFINVATWHLLLVLRTITSTLVTVIDATLTLNAFLSSANHQLAVLSEVISTDAMEMFVAMEVNVLVATVSKGNVLVKTVEADLVKIDVMVMSVRVKPIVGVVTALTILVLRIFLKHAQYLKST